MSSSNSTDKESKAEVWRSLPADLTDEEWDLIRDLVPTYSGGGAMGRPAKWQKREIVNAVLYVAATGCQWRALPDRYPHWNTVHRYHVTWSRDGTWEKIVDRLRRMLRVSQGRKPDPTGSVIDARSVRGAATVDASSRGFDAAKRTSGRKVFGVVDTLGLLVAVVVVAANVSDNAGGTATVGRARRKCRRLKKIWHDSGFKRTFTSHCASIGLTAECVTRTSPDSFEVLPRRWVAERTWAWLVNHRRLRIDYERDPTVTAGFVWAAHARTLLRRLTQTPQQTTTSTN